MPVGSAIIQDGIYFLILLLLAKPLGTFMYQLFSGERTFLHPILRPVERGVYRLTGVEEDRTDYMHEHRIEEIWSASERVLVIVDGDAGAGTVLRNAWRLASALHGELVAAVTTPPGGIESLPHVDRRALEKNIVLAEDLGARVRIIEARDAVTAIADVVRDEHATLVVMRHVRQTGLRRFAGPSLVDQLMDRLDNVDIHLVEGALDRR